MSTYMGRCWAWVMLLLLAGGGFAGLALLELFIMVMYRAYVAIRALPMEGGSDEN